MSDVEIIREEQSADSFDIVIVEKSVGTLETNIGAVEKFAEQRLKDYLPENYMGDSDLAKKDRTELNKAVDILKKTRQAIVDDFTKPIQNFETRCKALEKKLEKASDLLGEIVKSKKREEDKVKTKQIEEMWKTKNFELFGVEKIFNPKWLNKTFKDKDISAEMDFVIDKTYRDLKSIEMFACVDDKETLKAHYLMNLDIAETIQYGEELQKQKEIAQKEKAEREEREHQQAVEAQKKDLVRKALNFEQNKQTENLAEQALAIAQKEEPVKPCRKEFVVSVKCYDEELMKLKAAMNALGIEYSVEELTF